MAALWPLSRALEFDASANPLVGCQAFFYNQDGLTPQTTYADSGLSTVSTVDGDGAVNTNLNGRWPAVYLSPTPGTYRCRVLDPDGAVLFDDDGISVPQDADFVPPATGDTDLTLLARTGDIKARHGTGAHSGWVRGAGRTIGSAVSGATERANDDCEDLFEFLWDADSTLTVSSGRGANSASDWAANKNIALPDYRGRGLVGLADMGNSASTLLSGVTIDNSETVTTLGATMGEGTHVISTGELPAHTHSDGTLAAVNHGHPFMLGGTNGDAAIDASGGLQPNQNGLASEAAYTGAVSGTNGQQIGGSGAVDVTGATGSVGSGTAHNNVQPSALITFYIKL